VFELVDSLPAWLIVLLIVGGSIVANVLVLILVRRIVSPDVLQNHHDVAGALINVIGVVFAVLLAFVVIAVWEQHGETEGFVDREAGAISNLLRTTEVYPDRARGALEESVLAYAESAIRDEWPAMARGRAGGQTSLALDAAFRAYAAFEPQSTREQLWHAQSIEQLNDISEARIERISRSGASLSGVMWSTVVFGAVLIVGYSYMFGVRNLLAQTILTSGLAGAIAFVIALILLLDLPFAGDLGISPEALEEVLSEERLSVIR
jgi:hypothetical protein